jgi:hypothetical protein
MRPPGDSARSVVSVGAGLGASLLTQWLVTTAWYAVTSRSQHGSHLLVPPTPIWTLGLSAAVGGAVAAALAPAARWRHATLVALILVATMAALVRPRVLADPATWSRMVAVVIGNQLGALPLIARRRTNGWPLKAGV